MELLRAALWRAIERIPEGFWLALTWLGDSGLLLPASVSIAFWLALSRRTLPIALQWALLFGTGGVLILASKLAFMGWGIGSARFNFTGFSGHTAISASVWPVALWLVACRQTAGVRQAAKWAGWLLAAAIGVSRLALFAHSFSEVATGFLLGVAVSAGLFAFQRADALPRVRGVWVALSLLAPLMLLTPGTPAPTQNALELMAMRLAGVERVYTREDLHRRP